MCKLEPFSELLAEQIMDILEQCGFDRDMPADQDFGQLLMRILLFIKGILEEGNTD